MFGTFDIDETIQAASVLVRLADRKMTSIRLQRLLYLADRACVLKRGSPIIAGTVEAAPIGMQHIHVRHLMCHFGEGYVDWQHHFYDDGLSTILHNGPDLMKLSEFEVEILAGTFQRHLIDSDESICALTRSFPEWKAMRDNESLSPTDLLTTIGIDPSDAAELIEEGATHDHMTHLFSRPADWTKHHVAFV